VTDIKEEIKLKLIMLKIERAEAWHNPDMKLWVAKNSAVWALEHELNKLSKSTSNTPESPKRHTLRGPKPRQMTRVIEEMKKDIENGFDIRSQKSDVLATRYGASRDTCRKALDKLFENAADI
jgi:hypothetical protein